MRLKEQRAIPVFARQQQHVTADPSVPPQPQRLTRIELEVK
jgi:hypothetical protein